MEAKHLRRYEINYFSDLINIEEVWKKIDAVLIPSVLELFDQPKLDVPQTETEATSDEPLQLKLTELELAQKVYDEVVSVTSSEDRPTFFDVEKNERSLKSIIEEIVLTREKVVELEEIG